MYTENNKANMMIVIFCLQRSAFIFLLKHPCFFGKTLEAPLDG